MYSLTCCGAGDAWACVGWLCEWGFIVFRCVGCVGGRFAVGM